MDEEISKLKVEIEEFKNNEEKIETIIYIPIDKVNELTNNLPTIMDKDLRIIRQKQFKIQEFKKDKIDSYKTKVYVTSNRMFGYLKNCND